MYKPKNIIVIGGNAAGPAAAAKAKRINPDANVMMFEKGEYISTGTCELPYVLSGEIDSEEKIIFFDESSFFESKGVKVFTDSNVTGINPKNKSISVALKSGSVESFNYDSLVICTGAKVNPTANIPPGVINSSSLKTVSDLKKIKSDLVNSNVKSIAVIGAGYIGLETADALVASGYEIKLFHKDKLPLSNAEPEIGNLISEELIKNEVEFIPTCGNLKFVPNGNKIESIKIGSRFVHTDYVITATGFLPETSLTDKIGITKGSYGGIAVDQKLQTSVQGIFAAGDCIEVTDYITNKKTYFPLATLAHSTGHIAGENAAGGNSYFKPVVKNVAVKIFNHVYSQVGLTESDAREAGFKLRYVSAVAPNIIKVMPESSNVFGKIVFEKESKKILGASFFGKKEVIGFADLLSALIKNNISADTLNEVEFNYTPPLSPFVNLLSILGRKIAKEN